MAITVTINGTSYTIPETGEKDWGDDVTSWISAASSGLLQKAGGNFTLTANVDFGANFGLLVKFLSSNAANPADDGVIRLANGEEISWRNAADTANIDLKVDTDDKLYFNGVEVVDLTSTQTLENKTLTSPVVNDTLTGTAVLDEDNMASNSDTQVATQQSIKTYVDNQVGNALQAPRAELLDDTNTTLPLADPVTIDGVQVADGDDVLFTNLSSDNNKLYKATVSGTEVTAWAVQAVFRDGSDTPSAGEIISIADGTIYGGTIRIFDGSDWQSLGSTIDHGELVGLANDDHTQYLLVDGTRDQNYITFDNSPSSVPTDSGTVSWNDTDKTLDLQINSDVVQQIGQEAIIYGKNTTGSQIDNGQVVYINGADSGQPTFELADASNISSHRTVGIATENIADTALGNVVCRGKVRGIDTSAWAVGTAIFVDTTPGGLTSTIPSTPDYPMFVGVVLVQNATTGVLYVDIRPGYYLENILNVEGSAPSTGETLRFDGTNWTGDDIFNEVGRFTGVEDRTETTMTFTDGTKTFSIQPTGADFSYWVKGNKYTSTGDTVVITDDHELHVIYYDGSTLTAEKISSVTTNLFKDVCIISYVYWDSNISRSLGFAEERHGANMDEDTHQYLHETEGTRYESGLAPVVNDTNTSSEEPQIIVGPGVIWDEDIEIAVAGQGTDASTDPAEIRIFYKEGASGSFVWKAKTADDFCVIQQGAQDLAGNTIVTGGTFPAYNELTGGSWQLTEISGSNQFWLMHLFTTNGIQSGTAGDFIIICGEDEYNTAGQARDAAPTEIANIVTDGLPIKEFRAVATFILQSTTNGSNTVKAYFRTTDEGEDFVDFRVTQTVAIGSANDHGGLSGLGDDDHTQYALLAGRGGASTVTDDQIGYLNDVTSDIQAQLDSKQDDLITTRGDIIVGDATGAADRLALGAVGTVLTSDGTDADWATPAGTGDVTAAANLTNDSLIRGDGGAKGVQETGIIVDDSDNMSNVGNISCSSVTSILYTNIADVTLSSTGAGVNIETHTDAGDDFTVNTDMLVVEGDTSNIGISTDSPTVKLEIHGNTSTPPSFSSSTVASIVRNNQASDSINFSIIGGASANSSLLFGDVNSEDVGAITYNHSSNHMTFRTNSASDRLLIDSSGNIGIGTNAPDSPLHIFDSTDEQYIKVEDSSAGGQAGIKFKNDAREYNTLIDTNDNWLVYDITASAARLTIATDGTFTGSSTNDISDERLKENISSIEKGLETISQLKARTFTWKKSAKMPPGVKYGFLAQELEEVVPALVHSASGIRQMEDGTFYKSINTSGVIPILVRAVQELTEIKDQQQVTIKSLKTRIEALETS